MRVSNKQIITNGNMNANITGPAYLLDQVYGCSIQAVFTGTPAGTLSLQASCDPGPTSQVSPALDQPTNWTTITGTAAVISAAGNQMWNVDLAFYEWIRLVYVDGGTGGTGTLNARISTKGI